MTRLLSMPLFLAALSGCAGMSPTSRTPKPSGIVSSAEKSGVVESARKSFRTAQAAGGEYAAPYDYYLAEGYLDLAVRERDEGDAKALVEFAEKSKIHSARAIEKAGGGAK